jgi:CRP-like cAMP-binding protein
MSLFDSEPRSASVTALEECECLVLTQLQLYDAIDETPGIAVNIIRLLSRRIRELNSKVNTYEARNPTPDFSRAGSNLGDKNQHYTP